MLLANIAWILASNGRRTLVVDWDLEAPGLHRYFQPFLDDKDMLDTDGVIDFVVDFSIAATTPVDQASGDDPTWFHQYADLTRYAKPLRWEFAGNGRVDFVGAGRQGPSYSTRVNEFNWQDFYDRFGGSVLLDRARQFMRERYDYVLIDSRTGVSDTSGVCTVQLPDTVVVCFMLNNQNIEGASAVARSVRGQRAKVRILPVPTRIERSEKDKLDLRRSHAMRRFGDLIDLASQGERDAYWTDVEQLYEPYYAYEEVLATFRDRPGERNTILASAERLTSRIAGTEMRAVRVSEPRRQAVLAEYAGVPFRLSQPRESTRGAVYISYRRSDTARYAGLLYDRCAAVLGAGRLFMDVNIVEAGEDYIATVDRAVHAADVVLVVISPRTRFDVGPDDQVDREVATALRLDKRVIPVLVDGARLPARSEFPPELASLASRTAVELRDTTMSEDMDRLLAAIEIATSGSYPVVSEPAYAPVPQQPSPKTEAVIDTVLRSRATTRLAVLVTVVSVLVTVVTVLLTLLRR